MGERVGGVCRGCVWVGVTYIALRTSQEITPTPTPTHPASTRLGNVVCNSTPSGRGLDARLVEDAELRRYLIGNMAGMCGVGLSGGGWLEGSVRVVGGCGWVC